MLGFELGAEDGHYAFHAVVCDGFGLEGFGFGGGGVVDDGEDGGGEAFFGFVEVVVKEPVAEADVLPHVAFGGLLFVTADDGGDAVADAHDGAVLLVAEEAGAAVVNALGEVGQPVVLTPDDLGFDVFGKLVVDHFFVELHLAGVFRAEEDFEGCLPDDGDDGIAQGGDIVLFHFFVPGVFFGVELDAFFDLPVGGAAELGDAADEFAVLQADFLQPCGGGGV